MCRYIQTIDITSINVLLFGNVRIKILYRNKQYFSITDIVISRDHCNTISFPSPSFKESDIDDGGVVVDKLEEEHLQSE